MSILEFRVAREFDVVTIKRDSDAEEHIKKCKGKCCLGCEEKFIEGQRTVRGLCLSCYNGVQHLIKSTKGKKNAVTERGLLRDGRILPAAKGGRRRANKFIQSLAEAS